MGGWEIISQDDPGPVWGTQRRELKNAPSAEPAAAEPTEFAFADSFLLAPPPRDFLGWAADEAQSRLEQARLMQFASKYYGFTSLGDWTPRTTRDYEATKRLFKLAEESVVCIVVRTYRTSAEPFIEACPVTAKESKGSSDGKADGKAESKAAGEGAGAAAGSDDAGDGKADAEEDEWTTVKKGGKNKAKKQAAAAAAAAAEADTPRRFALEQRPERLRFEFSLCVRMPPGQVGCLGVGSSLVRCRSAR
jgi:hypothetical protein